MGPSGYGTLMLLLVVFAAAVAGVGRVRAWWAALPLAVLAFVAAATCGISSVNAYYGYYTSWSALSSDLRQDNGSAATPRKVPVVAPQSQRPGSTPVARDPRPWRVSRIDLPGPISGVQHRQATVVLPPSYPQTGHPSVALPVLELLHGEPGDPSSWTGGLQIAAVLQQAAAGGQIGPMVVVLPDVRGSFPGQQCLDARPGARLATWLSQDVPADLTAAFAVAPPGAQWLLGGLSEGAFCAADLVLRHPQVWAGAAVLDGYFHPEVTALVRTRVYAGNAVKARADDPTLLVRQWPAAVPLPAFWVMAGTANAHDYGAAVAFSTEVGRRADPRFVTITGGRHTTPAWRTALPDLLHWAWITLDGGALTGSVSYPVG